MQFGVAQLNLTIGDFEGNESKILQAIETAKLKQIDCLVFTELCVSGYPAKDLLLYDGFMDQVEHTVRKIVDSTDDIAIILGTPVRNKAEKGHPLFNAALFIADGDIKDQINKTLLPDYDIFDETRYFQSNDQFKLVEYKGKKIAVTICEDIWNRNNGLYAIDPVEEVMRLNPDYLCCLSASPFDTEQMGTRKDLLQGIAKDYQTPVVYANQIGGQTEIIFDGGSMMVNDQGEITDQFPLFEEGVFACNQQIKSDVSYNSIELIHQALVAGVIDYFNKLGFKKAVVGLSGGIDSAVVTTIAAQALGAENVHTILMPSQYSSDHSISDSLELVENLGVSHEIIAIKDIYHSFEQQLSTTFEGKEADLTEENLQARIRGTLLMAYSNKFGNIVLNTSNKSEMAVGYSTIYGDMNGGLSMMGDLLKSQVFDLARSINKEQEIIPTNIITKPPSAELRPDQKDSDSLPDYDVLDAILVKYLIQNQNITSIIQEGFDASLVKKVIHLVNINEYKRYQSPPIIKLSRKAFGIGRRMPIVGKYKF